MGNTTTCRHILTHRVQLGGRKVAQYFWIGRSFFALDMLGVQCRKCVPALACGLHFCTRQGNVLLNFLEVSTNGRPICGHLDVISLQGVCNGRLPDCSQNGKDVPLFIFVVQGCRKVEVPQHIGGSILGLRI